MEGSVSWWNFPFQLKMSTSPCALEPDQLPKYVYHWCSIELNTEDNPEASVSHPGAPRSPFRMGAVISPSCWLCCMHAQLLSCVQHFVTPWTETTRLLCPWDFPSKNTEAGCYFLLQVIFPTQGLNLGLLHWPVESLPLSHLGSAAEHVGDVQSHSPFWGQPCSAIGQPVGIVHA